MRHYQNYLWAWRTHPKNVKNVKKRDFPKLQTALKIIWEEIWTITINVKNVNSNMIFKTRILTWSQTLWKCFFGVKRNPHKKKWDLHEIIWFFSKFIPMFWSVVFEGFKMYCSYMQPLGTYYVTCTNVLCLLLYVCCTPKVNRAPDARIKFYWRSMFIDIMLLCLPIHISKGTTIEDQIPLKKVIVGIYLKHR